MQRTLLMACLICCISLMGSGVAAGKQAQDLQLIEDNLIEYQNFLKPGVRFYDVI